MTAPPVRAPRNARADEPLPWRVRKANACASERFADFCRKFIVTPGARARGKLADSSGLAS